ncbi:hypothetical protein MYCTH_2131229 [Thermothelomyces thermophilus ATCC 42464]|uniref:Uncharacterized protein n=1 Tax=Thermothelomyces thermophilus (strain ATCC 42464 / BCRC 31852 / DSM 1799) TaxID=573729 RepID=G2QNH4_THET4|nr:uncharacterized protein MYCTH_2131229 [Thermothelomyces thermophilus ATCC 42464]AEO62047.1 hypothetical protein MYCTH_2131229 [Thermothelomyces thermophilus ATCC 42464]
MTHQVKSAGDGSFSAKYSFWGFGQEDVVGSDEGEASYVWPQRLPTFMNVKVFHHQLLPLPLETPDSRVHSLSDSQAFENLTRRSSLAFDPLISLSDSQFFKDLTSLSSSAFDPLDRTPSPARLILLIGPPDSRVHSLSDSPIFEVLTSLSSSAFDPLDSSHVRGLSKSHISIKIYLALHHQL